MKHIYKYIFVAIIALLFTSTLQAAPKAFDSLGNELEAMQKDCKQYLKDPQRSKKLKATCKKFNAKVNKAFKVGYPLDASVESDTADEKKTGRYLALLRKADKSGESLRELKRSREKKERKSLLNKQIKACDGGDPKVCYHLGVIFYKGQDMQKNYGEASKFFGKACDGGNADGCSALGFIFYDGVGVEENNEEAARLFSKACDGGNGRGCKNYAIMKIKKRKHKGSQHSRKEKTYSEGELRKIYASSRLQDKYSDEVMQEALADSRDILSKKDFNAYNNKSFRAFYSGLSIMYRGINERKSPSEIYDRVKGVYNG